MTWLQAGHTWSSDSSQDDALNLGNYLRLMNEPC